jgi:hypothetical protein
VYSTKLSAILRVASVGTGAARHEVIRLGFNRDGTPRVTLAEARSHGVRHADRVIFQDPDGREWRWSFIGGLSDEETRRLIDQRPDVWKAYELDENYRAGPPGRPSELWDDEY